MIQEYYEHYDIATKVVTLIENGEVVHTHRWEQCPYIFSDEIKAGLVSYVMWTKAREN